jgi:hypothetical protein
LSSDDEDDLTSSLLWNYNEQNYGAIDLGLDTRWRDEDMTEVEGAECSIDDEESLSLVEPESQTRCQRAWLAALLCLWTAMGAAGILFLLLLGGQGRK